MDAAMLPLVSIVTPSFNQGRFFRRTIDSVLSQDYPHIEYLVFDGGSTDQSPDILKSYGERFFWRSQTDRGQTDAINQGMRRGAATSWHISTPMTFCCPAPSQPSSRTFAGMPMWTSFTATPTTLTKMIACSANIRRRRSISSVCCKRASSASPRRSGGGGVVERFGLFDASLHYAMDYEYWLRLARAGVTFAQVPEILAGSRIHEHTKTLSARMEVYREILAVSRRHAPDASFSQYYAYWHHRCHERATGWPRLCAGCRSAIGGWRMRIGVGTMRETAKRDNGSVRQAYSRRRTIPRTRMVRSREYA